MTRAHNEWTDRFTDYLADELDAASREALEDHVAECGACRGVLEEVRDVMARARGLEELHPPRDLWPGIAAAIRGPVRPRAEAASARVIALPTSGRARSKAGARTIAFTAPQLAAAAIVLIGMSVMTTWWAGPGLGVRDAERSESATRVAEGPAGAGQGSAVTPASDLPTPPDALSEELATLEEVLGAAHSRLDPNTVRVLERNLDVIERAIADSHRALALDPGNEFLTQHLERVYQRKIEYLNDVARVIDWAG